MSLRGETTKQSCLDAADREPGLLRRKKPLLASTPHAALFVSPCLERSTRTLFLCPGRLRLLISFCAGLCFLAWLLRLRLVGFLVITDDALQRAD